MTTDIEQTVANASVAKRPRRASTIPSGEIFQTARPRRSALRRLRTASRRSPKTRVRASGSSRPQEVLGSIPLTEACTSSFLSRNTPKKSRTLHIYNLQS
jgi:hypothetical protein